MAELTVPQIDFSSLGQLPDVYQKARTQAVRDQTLANLGSGGAVDASGLNGAALRLAQSGDLAGATSLATLGKTMAAPEQTDFIKNYQFAVKNGFQGTPFEYETAIKKAGATRVNNVINSGEKAYDTKVGGDYGDQFVGYQRQGRNAAGSIGTLDLMENLTKNPNFYSGAGGEAVTALKRAASNFGITTPDNASANEVFGALGNKLVLDSAGGSLGTGFSNADRDFLQKTVPTLGTTPEGNRALIGVMRKVYGRQQEVAQLARNYAKNNKGRIDAGFDQALAEWTNQHPLFPGAPAGQGEQEPPAVQQRPAAAQPPPAVDKAGYDALPSGARYTAPDGKVRVKR
jgi:hypothetical protein